MTRIAAFVLMTAAAAMAASKSYTVNLLAPATFGGVELQPGEYKVEVNDTTAVIHKGKVRGESPVKVESSESKYDTTSVRLDHATGKPKIQEIRVGGTKTKLVFTDGAAASRAVN
jgi:hypothetical protein